ncbi:MAG TPA: gliding motility-associated ABC transporter substrate-binding protein GldG, partial [Chitinophagaceae bacterium]
RLKTQTIAYDRNLNLTDMLFRYGVRINPSLIMDLQCDFMPFRVGGADDNPQFEFLHWNYYPLFEAKGNHPINKNLGLVSGRFANPMDTIITPGITKTVLLSSSANSRIISTPVLISTNENRNAPEDEKFRQRDIPVAFLVEGEFNSVFRNRISKVQLDTLNAMGVPFRESSPDNKMIIVGDGDMVLNDVSSQNGPLPMGLNFFTAGTQYEYQFANRDFLLNCMEYLVSNPALSETRNKDIVLRLLDTKKVEDQKTTWQLINIALPILLIVFFGFIYQQIRKRRYAS